MSLTEEDVPNLPYDYNRGYGEYLGEFGEYEPYDADEEVSIYNSDDFISGASRSENSTIPIDILEFDFSYGYDCKRYFNIAVPDSNTIVFASGNFINFLNVESREINFRRSALGGGIGHITVNPNPDYNHLAIAENGYKNLKPIIIIYEWPSMEINCILRHGSSHLYTYLDYSPNGELLVSQGGEPDYLITVFDWPSHRILLRTKSYNNDVFRVKFSPFVPGQLTSSGVQHIKFWKMATTFTGLKLKGELGRFGKTEFSDIIGILPMPDEKVVSGCSWGNILIWEGGLIKLEVFRTLRRKCHEAQISQIFYINEELWTVSMDGHVKIWSYEKIDQADPPDEDRVIQIEPSYDFIHPDIILMSIKKRTNDPQNFEFFAQDGNGGLCSIDINLINDPRPPEQLYKCHAGKVVDIAASPHHHSFGSLGEDGRFYLYDYKKKKIIFSHQFPAKGSCMIWLPVEILEFGDEIIFGFDDGTLRLAIITIEMLLERAKLDVIQIIKPHNKPVTAISLNSGGEVLVSGGEDATIFIFKVSREQHEILLVPIGYISVPDVVTCLTWNIKQPCTILVGCLHGQYIQVDVPYEVQSYTIVSYLLRLEPITRNFLTYKAQIRRDIKLREIEAKKAEKIERKRKEMEKIKAENPGFEIDEEVFLEDSESTETLEPLHIPEVANRILWIQSTEDNTIWLSMGGYDAGYIYEYYIDQKEEIPFRFKMVDDADDIEISSFLYTRDKNFLIFAMQDGVIRINKVNRHDFRDLKDYYTLPLHDNLNGFVPKMCFSEDERYLFTCGYDGNVFAYKFNGKRGYLSKMALVATRSEYPNLLEDSNYYHVLSLEEAMVKAEEDRIQALANKHKEITRKKILKLEKRFYNHVVLRNQKLLPSQIIPQHELELDKRVTEYIDNKLKQNLDLVKRKLAFDVEKSEIGMKKLLKHFIEPVQEFPIQVTGILKNISVKILRHRKLDPEFQNMIEICVEKIKEATVKNKPPERQQTITKSPPPKKKEDDRIEYFLMSLSPSVIENKLGSRLFRLLMKYRERKKKWESRKDDWEQFLAKKPQLGVVFPEDEAVITNAEKTIGDYKLKSSMGYAAPKHVTTVRKYKELLEARKKQLNLRKYFNNEVFALRLDKVKLRQDTEVLLQRLEDIHEELPESQWNQGPRIPPDDGSEFPEELIKVKLEREEVVNVEGSVILMEPDNDELELELLPKRKISEMDIDELKNQDFRTFNECSFEELLLLSSNNAIDTPLEKELRIIRYIRKTFDQREVIKNIDRSIDKFNKTLKHLTFERQETQVKCSLMDLHILFLHQELIILKEFESVETGLQENVNERRSAVLDMQENLDELNTKLNDFKVQNNLLNDNSSKIQDTFIQAVSENKFYDFLKRVFRKKYRLPKIKKDDDSSNSSSSSSSDETEDDDQGSVDSRDFGIIKQDLNVCPKGCDPAIYDLTVKLRSERHELEIAQRQITKEVELTKKDLEISTKKIKMLQQSLKASKDDLAAFQREKQQRLNKIKYTVIIQLSQIQNFTDDKFTHVSIEDSLIFSKITLNNLYKRVGELNKETEMQLSIHTKNIKHLARMSTDCKYMVRKIDRLKGEVVKAMLVKFGKVVDILEVQEAMIKRTFGKDDITDLTEVVLKKLVYDLRLSLINVREMYEGETVLWKKKVKNAEIELTKKYKENTAKLELLTLLSEEKLQLSQAVQHQKEKKQSMDQMIDKAESWIKENEKLTKIVDGQKKQIQELKEEIKILRTKGLTPEEKRAKLKKVEAEEDEESITWMDYDEYLKSKLYLQKLKKQTSPEPKTSEEFDERKFMLSETEETIKTIINELLERLGTLLTRSSSENLVQDILQMIMERASVSQIVKEIIRHLPEKDLSEEKLSILETSAEKLYCIEEPEVSEGDINQCATEIIKEVLRQVALETSSSHEFIALTLEYLVEELPVEYISKEDNIKIIGDFIREYLDVKLDEESLKEVRSLTQQSYSDDMRSILKMILEEVYASAIDYLYYIDL